MTAHLSDTASLVYVAGHGIIIAAARASGVPKSTISRLEVELGV